MRDLFTPPNQRWVFLEGVVIVAAYTGCWFALGSLSGWFLRVWWVR